MKVFRKQEKQKEKNRIRSERYYEKNNSIIIPKRKARNDKKYKERLGHISMVYSAVRRYAKENKIDIISEKEFKRESALDPMYDRLYDQWVENDYSVDFSPMITRIHYKGDYTSDNIKWVTKEDCNLGDLEAQRDTLEIRAAITEELAETAMGYGFSTKCELKHWLKSMPAMYSPSSLDETLKRIESIFKREKYKYDETFI
jgi:hypothetical protein